MPCPYLTTENRCIAKPYGVEAYTPAQENLEEFCRNEYNMVQCKRAVIFKAYLKSGGK